MPGIVIKISAKEGAQVTQGEELVILESMKMENAIESPHSGVIISIFVQEGQVVNKGDLLLEYTISENSKTENVDSKLESNNFNSDRLKELQIRKSYLEDEARPQAVGKRRLKDQNTARENIERLVDPGSFREYGSLIVAAQRSRRSEEDLIRNTPADGLITGRATINGDLFKDHTSCLVMAYDYTVLAGTQGTMNHVKMDRVIAVAKKNRLPVILFAEGGGGRPGDVDQNTIAGLFISTFVEFASLHGLVPTISIVSGYCFAGNAALAGSSDIIIGTKNLSLGMGGPAMIEGGGLGKFHPSEVGPSEIQSKNGVIDILAENENEAISTTKKLLAFWQGPLENWNTPDQDILQHFIPNNRKRTFDVRALIRQLVDEHSSLELRPNYGKGMITYFARIEGKPIGILANDSAHDGGAITSVNAMKATSFLELCDRYNISVLSLIDTPGIMVGPEAEKSGTVRHAGNLFIAGAKFKPTFLSVVVRRAYGLGAMAMMGGSTHRSDFTVSWPTGEFGAMGLEGAVKLGFRKELEAIEDLGEREKAYNKMVDEAYERGKALSMAAMFEIDDVIEPKETRFWISSALK